MNATTWLDVVDVLVAETGCDRRLASDAIKALSATKLRPEFVLARLLEAAR